MSFSLPATIRAHVASLLAPDHRLNCPQALWRAGLAESGAFLLGAAIWVKGVERRRVSRFVYYDDLDPRCLDRGIIIFDGSGYGPLWQLCRETDLSVVADVHTHPFDCPARQSGSDRAHPMVATPGHIALIVPDLAQHPVAPGAVGVYQYLGNHEWRDCSDIPAQSFFYLGRWV